MEKRLPARPYGDRSHHFDGHLAHTPVPITPPSAKQRRLSRNSDAGSISIPSKRYSESRKSQRFDGVSRGSREVVYERVERSHHNWPPSPRDSKVFTVEPAHSIGSRESRKRRHKTSDAEPETVIDRRSHGGLSPPVSPTRKPVRHHADLAGIGSWCETNHQDSHSNSRQIPPRAPSPPMFDLDLPSSPELGRLPTPDIGPLSTHYQFCSCCEDNHDRITDTWHMTWRSRKDALCKSVQESQRSN